MERHWRFCQNKHGFLNIGSTSIIPEAKILSVMHLNGMRWKTEECLGFSSLFPTWGTRCFMYLSVAYMYMFWNWCIYMNTNVDSCRYTNGTTTFTYEYDIHGTVSQILSSHFPCPFLSISQWHRRVLRLGSECLHRWETPGQHHGWTHTGPGWVQSLGQLITYRTLLVCRPMNSFSFSTQLLPIIAEQLWSWHAKTLLIKMSAVCAYGHNAIIILSGCWLIG